MARTILYSVFCRMLSKQDGFMTSPDHVGPCSSDFDGACTGFNQLRHFEMTSSRKSRAIYWFSSVYGQMNANFTSFYIIMCQTILYRVFCRMLEEFLAVLANQLDIACLIQMRPSWESEFTDTTLCVLKF